MEVTDNLEKMKETHCTRKLSNSKNEIAIITIYEIEVPLFI